MCINIRRVTNQVSTSVYHYIITLCLLIIKFHRSSQMHARIIDQNHRKPNQPAYQLCKKYGTVFTVGIGRSNGFFGKESFFIAKLLMVCFIRKGILNKMQKPVHCIFLRFTCNGRYYLFPDASQ